MILNIDTTHNDLMTISLKKGKEVVVEKKIKTDFNQAEKLLPSIIRLLKSKNISIPRVTKIMVANRGGSFTSLRIGVVTANALGFALKIPVTGPDTGDALAAELLADFDVIEPIYDREPNITIKKA